MDILDQVKAKMKAAIDHLKEELKGLRTNRATPAMLDNISVDVYGTHMRVKDISSITTPEPRQLLVTPFDPTNTAAIGKAIQNANIGFSPIVEANLVRIKIPPMDENMRKEMVKLSHKMCEETKVRVRQERREGNEAVRKKKSTGDIDEDLTKNLEKKIQELTDKFCKEADDLTAAKEKEITTI